MWHTVDYSQSSSATVIAKGAFSISYVTPNSGVVGDYITDNFAVGSASLQSIIMAVATDAAYVPTGIMGIGFDTDESIASQAIYPNFIDEMVKQNLIKTRAYSLWLDDLGMSPHDIAPNDLSPILICHVRILLGHCSIWWI